MSGATHLLSRCETDAQCVSSANDVRRTSMSGIETVRGPIEADGLGATLVHEHVFVRDEEIESNYPELWDEASRVTDAVARLRALKEKGVDSILDPTVIGHGRDIRRVIEINSQVDINIVAATGIYTYNDVPLFFHFHGPGTLLGGPEAMVDMFVKDLTEGIAGTAVKAGFLKCAIDDTLTPGVERIFAAVAEASLQTGAPITVHSSAPHGTGLVAQEWFTRAGIDPAKLVIGHCGDTADLDYLHRVIDGGSYLGMDRFGLDIFLPDDQRIATVATLVDEGYADRLMLSQDASCHIDWLPPGTREAALPNWHYTHIHDDVLPMLREQGVGEHAIATMLVENPRRYLVGE
ncbi:phosphotriesterase-related protein [Microbacterium sp. BWT-B31]|uniref:phosphotriesterase family protein n=1 Tax=Microbacterium sp. BWT-B31 TaxID=3232072 RepID=UPI003528D445